MRFAVLTPLAPLFAAACSPAQVDAPSPTAAARAGGCEVTMQTRRSGASTTTRLADGSLAFDFHYLQNGRGPTMKARAHLAGDGTLLSYAARGKAERGGPIDETFAVDEGGRARWRSPEESGSAQLSGPAFYLPMSSPPEIMGLLVAALRRHGGQLALLPGGTARLERERDVVVTGPAGRKKTLVAWAVTGLALAPARVFTEQDGTYFGVADEWFACLPPGWSGAIEPLVAFQRQLDVEAERRLADRLAHRPPPAGLAIVKARVLDIERRRWLPDHTVVVVGGRIAAVGPTGRTRPPAGAEIVDAAGKALLPGLWDMHTHNQPTDGRLAIAAGITTVRDLANDPDRLDDYKRRWDEGTAIGPHLLRSGFIEGRGASAAASKITATNEREAAAAVAEYARRGYEGIKIYNSVDPELVPLLARLAHRRGMRVSGHIPAFMSAEDAVRAGYDEIQHMNMVFLNFLADRTTDTRTQLRVSLVAEKAGELDLSSPEVADFIRLLREKKTVLDPTMYIFELLLRARPGQVLAGMQSVVSRLPPQARREYRIGGIPVPAGKQRAFQRSYAALLAMLKRLHDAGVPIVAGTDAPGGLTMHRELEIYVEAGLSPAEAIYTATLGPARVMKRDRTSGSIEVGKDADLILVDGDPLADIGDLRNVVSTVRSGVVYSSASLHRSLGMAPAR